MNERSDAIDRHNTYRRNPLFLRLENAELLSAIIYYTDENTYQDIKFKGEIVTNDSAVVKLDEEAVEELKDIFFT